MGGSQTTAGHSVREDELDGYATIVLASAAGELEAAFAPAAGMLGCSLAHAGEQLLWLGDGIDRYVRDGATIGIPLLHPWANRLSRFGYTAAGRSVELDPGSPLIKRDPNGLPIHGLLGGSPHWHVREAEARGGGRTQARGADRTEARGGGRTGAAVLRAELDFGAHEQLLAGFPFPHLLEIDVELAGSELTIRTTVTATGAAAVPVSFGYHPYLRLPGVPREQWEIELPVQRRLVLDERMIPTGETEPVRFERAPLADRTFDDGYAELVPGRPFVLAGGGREIAVSFEEGYPFAQVYSPPGGQFICFEPMTAPTDALSGAGGTDLPVVSPGESFSATFRITVSGGGLRNDDIEDGT